jgi:putative membrane protein
MTDRPLLIDLDGENPSPADAPPVADIAPRGQAMQTVAVLAARPRSWLWAWLWRSAGAVLTFLIGVALWTFVENLIARSPLLGWAAILLIGSFTLLCFAVLIRELAALSRLARVDAFQKEAAEVLGLGEVTEARRFATKLAVFYRGREDTRWGRARLEERAGEAFDADTILTLAEDTLLAPLDAAAIREVEAAARQVATVTALVPLAFADVLTALTANIRMIRRIAEIYGGRSGTFGAWRLTRAVLTHLVATGAVAVGDDLIHSVGGGTVLAKVSRRFGEGVVNGALTARVGVAAMEVCRPLPFGAGRRPRVTRLVQRALTGLFDRNA